MFQAASVTPSCSAAVWGLTRSLLSPRVTPVSCQRPSPPGPRSRSSRGVGGPRPAPAPRRPEGQLGRRQGACSCPTAPDTRGRSALRLPGPRQGSRRRGLFFRGCFSQDARPPAREERSEAHLSCGRNGGGGGSCSLVLRLDRLHAAPVTQGWSHPASRAVQRAGCTVRGVRAGPRAPSGAGLHPGVALRRWARSPEGAASPGCWQGRRPEPLPTPVGPALTSHRPGAGFLLSSGLCLEPDKRGSTPAFLKCIS